MIEINGPEICLSGDRKNVIVCLHGWGASGDSFIHVAKIMSKFLPYSHFIAPNAPFVRKTGGGYQWFGLENRAEEILYNGVKHAASIVNCFIDKKLKEMGLNDTQLSLIGFSQGAMLAIHASLTRVQPCSSVVAYSGRFIAPSQVTMDIKSTPEMCIIHGDADDVVPFSCFDLSVQTLKKHGVNIEAHAIHALGHIINDDGIKLGVEFIKRNFCLK
ncbi:phospholipase [Wolbachia pipientis]|uniref:Phospholipase n=1 Tax=Wolbachia pipientis TaxID=955 RepID=A0A1E7QL07_WOLPI|nr:alpha/beta fold hydrolase [Wolbachia pipientis]OEY87158.1 phospholipase [Wolbachia pipientis]